LAATRVVFLELSKEHAKGQTGQLTTAKKKTIILFLGYIFVLFFFCQAFECGYLHRKIGGSKKFKCQRCNQESDRDFNAARNILLKNMSLVFRD
jgi:hypothetical protein